MGLNILPQSLNYLIKILGFDSINQMVVGFWCLIVVPMKALMMVHVIVFTVFGSCWNVIELEQLVFRTQ